MEAHDGSQPKAYFNPYKLFVGSFIPEWLERRKEISPGAKLCYARLLRHADRETGLPGRSKRLLARSSEYRLG